MSTPLSYAAGSPRLWTRRRLRLVLVLAVVVALSGGWILWGRHFWAQARYLYQQHRLLKHTLPADRVVYESDVRRAAALLGTPGYGPALREGLADLPDEWWWRSPAFYSPAEARALANNPAAEGLAFMHRLRLPGGPERLVIVWLEYEPDLHLHYLNLRAHVCIPASWKPGSRLHRRRGRSDSVLRINDYDPQLRLFAGQPDPNDASHFTIAYSYKGKPGVIDGYLRQAPADDRDHPFGTIHYQIRSGPLRGMVSSEQETPVEGVPAPP